VKSFRFWRRVVVCIASIAIAQIILSLARNSSEIISPLTHAKVQDRFLMHLLMHVNVAVLWIDPAENASDSFNIEESRIFTRRRLKSLSQNRGH